MKRIASIWLPALAIEHWAKSADCPPDAVSPALTLSLSKGVLSDAEGGERERFDKLNVSAIPPVVLTVEGPHGPIIHAVTRAAAERGARAGARLTDARALDPALVAMPADPAGDAQFVAKLARWAGRWSPLIEVDGADALRLDVTGVAHLFGGERGLVCDIWRRFARIGVTVRVAIAPTAAAAWALARYSPSPLEGEGGSGRRLRKGEGASSPFSPSPRSASLSRPLPQGERDLVELLSPLPVAALRLDPDTVRTLERLGLKTIGALIEMPRLALARRFRGAEDVVEALDRALGRKPEPLSAAPVEPPPRALLKLEEPATHPEAGTQALGRLIPPLVRELERRRLGARRLSLTGFRIDGSVSVASVATSIPSREPRHLQRLLADKVSALDPEFGFDAFVLTAEWAEELGAAQDSLVEAPPGERELARLVDRLTVKLGPRAVRQPRAVESHLPERASGWAAAILNPSPREGEGGSSRRLRKGEGVSCSCPSLPHPPIAAQWAPPSPLKGEGLLRRPQRLLDRPEAIDVIYATPEGMPRRFVWRRAVHDIARVEGPERIAPEWWRQPSSARLRDYYRVEDAAGRRYWIYREGLIGDGRGGLPGWYIHGLFG